MVKVSTRRAFWIVSLICVGLFVILGVGLIGHQVAYGQATNLRFSTWHVPVGYEVKTVWEPMLEELKKKSKSKITSTMYAGGALGKGPEHFDIVSKGLSDMGYFTATWTPGRFPLTDVLSLGRLGRWEGYCDRNRECDVQTSPQSGISRREDGRVKRMYPGFHVDQEASQDS